MSKFNIIYIYNCWIKKINRTFKNDFTSLIKKKRIVKYSVCWALLIQKPVLKKKNFSIYLLTCLTNFGTSSYNYYYNAVTSSDNPLGYIIISRDFFFEHYYFSFFHWSSTALMWKSVDNRPAEIIILSLRVNLFRVKDILYMDVCVCACIYVRVKRFYILLFFKVMVERGANTICEGSIGNVWVYACVQF